MVTDGDRECSSRHVEFALRVTDSFLWTIDVDTGRLVTHMGSAESLFNVPITEAKSVSDFHERAVHPRDKTTIEHASRRVLRGEEDWFEVTYRTHPDIGDVRWIKTHGRILSDGRREVLAGISTDVTDQKRRERQLQRENERLEQFATVVSHDLRNPLDVAAGHLELAKADHDSEHLDAVERSLERMDALLEDMLTSIKRGTPIIRGGETQQDDSPVDLATVAERCWEHVETGRATLSIEADLEIRADRQSLRQLFENLFRNAVEHGSTNPRSSSTRQDAGRASSSKPSVADAPEDAVEHGSTSPPSQAPEDAVEHGSTSPRSSSTPEDSEGRSPSSSRTQSDDAGRASSSEPSVADAPDNAVEHGGSDVSVIVDDLDDCSGFYVADDGPGIPESERDRIFETDTSTTDEGVGLGLHIVDGVVDAHDWEIAVTDSESGGARFEISDVETST